MSRDQISTARGLRWVAPTIVALVVCAGDLRGQEGAALTISAAPPERAALLSGSENALWLARNEAKTSVLFFRDRRAESFDLGRVRTQPIADLAVIGQDAYVFFADGSLYRFKPDQTDALPQRNLPHDSLPIELIGTERDLYAIVPSPIAAELFVLRPEETRERDRAPEVFDPAEAPLSIVRYDRREWAAVAACPLTVARETEAEGNVRLGLARGRLFLLWRESASGRLTIAHRSLKEGDWSEPAPIGEVSAEQFWMIILSRMPTVVAVDPAGEAEAPIVAYRLLGEIDARGAGLWRPAELRFSDLPPDVRSLTYREALGFNQHIALLGTTEARDALVRFARVDAAPAEASIDTRRVYAQPHHVRRLHELFQFATIMLLLIVLIGLFVFRRASMMQSVTYPPGCALASVAQRGIGALIDFVPFTLVSASLLDVSIADGLSVLAGWGLSPDARERTPGAEVLLWWGLSCLGYALYSLIMEWLAGRTVGKLIARTFVLSENGTRARFGQLLVRNGMRLMELLPQFWVFGLLVLLSRNQQRLGDIFARTYCARRVPLVLSVDEKGDDESDADRTERGGDDKPEQQPPTEPPDQ